MTERKKIILLIGQKGSGKSYIGNLLEIECGIKFIGVEEALIKFIKTADFNDKFNQKQMFEYIEHIVRVGLNDANEVAFEATGVTEYFDTMFSNLKKDYDVVTIGVFVDNNVCIERIKSRNKEKHFKVSDQQIEMINRLAREKQIRTDYVIENNECKEREVLIEEIKRIINKERTNLNSGGGS